MLFKTPSFSAYVSSLIISGLIAALVYAILQSQGIDSGITAITAGLLIGHLAGIFAAPKTSSKTKNKSSTPPTSGSSEPISLYVGNLSYNARRDALHELFAQFGPVNSVRIMTDRETRRPRGYGFVEMDGRAAQLAMSKLDGAEFFGRNLRVSEANQR